MPVTAKLSREFYEKFGDKIADELVNWFNQVDATYRSDLKDLNELNFARFGSKLDQGVGELRAELGAVQGRLDAKLEQRMAELDAKWERRFAEMDVRWERRMAEIRLSLIRWMVTLWTAGTLTVLGTVLAILKLKP